MKKEQGTSLKTITKSTIWDLQENDVMRLVEAALKDADMKENMRHYLDIVKSAFEIEELKTDKAEEKKAYTKRGFKVSTIKLNEEEKLRWAIKKRPIMRVTDLTYENINHISAAKLVEVLDRNFGGGWDSLSQSIKDIIEHGFDISTTTLPKDRLHKKGGMYEKKVEDGFEVLEIPKGNWTEAIFAKAKPRIEKVKTAKEETHKGYSDEEEDDILDSDTYNMPEEDEFDDEKLTEESYRTTYETDPEDLTLEAAEVSDDDDY